MKRPARIGLALVFVALLATPAIIRRFGHPSAPPAGAAGDHAPGYGFQLTEVSRASGIEFVHQAPTLDAKLSHIMPQVASMGAAVDEAFVQSSDVNAITVLSQRSTPVVVRLLFGSFPVQGEVKPVDLVREWTKGVAAGSPTLRLEISPSRPPMALMFSTRCCH